MQVVDIMRVNVDKVLERDQKLSELDDRADALQAGASQFETSAAKLKRKYWWKNCKVPTFNQIKTAHWTKMNENRNLLLLISLLQILFNGSLIFLLLKSISNYLSQLSNVTAEYRHCNA